MALITLSIEAPDFYQKQGYDVVATIDCDSPGLTRYYMIKKALTHGSASPAARIRAREAVRDRTPMAVLGHEERFPPPRLNGRCRFRKRSVATWAFESGS
jgi:hypothetical protein